MANFGMRLGLGLGISRRCSGPGGPPTEPVEDPVISGLAFPGEILESTIAGQWYVDNEAVSGETGNEYVVTIYDIGKDIRCDNSNVLTCWHPSDVPQVKSCRVPWEGVFNAVAPDTPAEIDETVRRWTDIMNGWSVDQATLANQPILRQLNNVRCLDFDGVNDFLYSDTGDELNIDRNTSYSGIIIGARDKNPTGGNLLHHLVYLSNGSPEIVIRIGITTRGGGSEYVFDFNGRRLDSDPYRAASTNNDSNFHTFSVFKRSALGTIQGFLDAVSIGSTNLSGSGNTSDTASLQSMIGNWDTYYAPAYLFCDIKWSGSSPITNSDHSRLQRFAMLCMGSNYTGPDIPLVEP